MAEERKASEILLSIESKLEDLIRFTRNSDSNLKLLLSSINKLIAATETKSIARQFVTPLVSPTNPAVPQQRPKMMMPQGPLLDMDALNKLENKKVSKPAVNEQSLTAVNPVLTGQKVLDEEPVDVDDDGNPLLSEELIHKGTRRDLRQPAKPGNTGTKIAVSQSITMNDGSKLFLANVEIFKDGKLIKQTRTNPKGRWIAPLDPGKYTVRVVKRISGENSKLPVEMKYTIEVPKVVGPIELEPPNTER